MVTIDVVQGSPKSNGGGAYQPLVHGQLAFVFLASMEGGPDPSLLGWRKCMRTLR